MIRRRRTREEMQADFNAWILMGRMKDAKRAAKKAAKPIKRRRSKPRRGPADIPADEWRNPAYRMYLREEGRCVVPFCYWIGGSWGRPGGCDPAHTINAKTSQKGPDSSCAPLCGRHHREFDGHAQLPNHADGRPRDRNHAAFEEFYGVDMTKEASAWWAAFQEWRANG